MKVKYSSLRNSNFARAVQKLSAYPFKGQKVAYNIMRITKFLEREDKTATELVTKLLKQLAQVDDKGEFVIADGGPVAKEGLEEEYKKAMAEYLDIELTIERYPIKIEDLEECRLSAMDLSAIECLLAPEEVAKEAAPQ